MEYELDCPVCSKPSGLFSHRYDAGEPKECAACKAPVLVRYYYDDEDDIEGHWYVERLPSPTTGTTES